jgi:hypothetical protein
MSGRRGVCRAQSVTEQREAILLCTQLYPSFCVRARSALFGASQSTIRGVDAALKDLREHGHAAERVHGNAGREPSNKAPLWIRVEFNNHLQKYSWCA